MVFRSGLLGHYPKEGLEKFKEYLPEITEEDMRLIHQPLDFMGQNIYNGYYVRQGADGEPSLWTGNRISKDGVQLARNDQKHFIMESNF